jgi:hypothetical protein
MDPSEGVVQALRWPVTHYVVIARALFLKGAALDMLMPHAPYRLAPGLTLSGLAVWQFKNKLGRGPWTSRLLRHVHRSTTRVGYWLQDRSPVA